ncbi:MAG: FHA domain-containing protein, partial [Myxococcota bacterium]|nr:FHA domain-containing protein [Myxococcota bacterium]
HARAAELRGDLARATALFSQGGRLDEAARVLLLQGDGESDPAVRLGRYADAVTTAPEPSAVRAHARRKRAMAVLAMATNAPLDARLQRDLLQAAEELEALGENGQAAEAYARAGEIEGQKRVLVLGGEVEKLDALLGVEQARERDVLTSRLAHGEFSALEATGRRREATRLARESADDSLRARGAAIEARRVDGPIVAAVLLGRRIEIALGDEVVIGRTPEAEAPSSRSGAIRVPSVAVSRRHLCVRRSGHAIIVRDLDSRNGTQLRGLALKADASVGEGIELTLGRDVRLMIRPAEELEGAVVVEVAGSRYIAPLGPARLRVGRWRLERAGDGWVELATDDAPPAFAGSLRLSPRVALVHGDVFAHERGGSALLELCEYGR